MMVSGVFLSISVCIHLINEAETNAVRNPKRKWPNGIVPYVYDSSLDSALRTVIVGAMKEIQTQTCIKFIARTKERNWINIIKRNSCDSQIGMSLFAVSQNLALGGCYNDHHDAVHELMHSLGFHHEQSRSDRDYYVTVLWWNIVEEFKPNFKKQNETDTTTLNTRNGYPAMEPKWKGNELGTKSGLSANDALKINLLYNCSTNGGAKPSGGRCSDTNPLCPIWKSNGDCGRNPVWLKTNCRKSCGQC